MKTGASDISDNTSNSERKSDIIRAELEKFRLLKLKNGLGSYGDINDGKPIIKSNFFGAQTPSKDETSQTIANALLQASNTSQNGLGNHLTRSEQRLAIPKKAINQTNNSHSNQNDALGGFSSDRGGKARTDSRLTNSSMSPTKDSTASSVTTRNKSPPAKMIVPMTNNTNKRLIPNKSVGSNLEDKRKQWGHIEEFVDTELDREMIKGQNKDSQYGVKPQSTLGQFSKSQSRWSKKEAPEVEKRASSALDGAGNGIWENKNTTPLSNKVLADDGGTKRGLESPKTPTTPGNKIRNRSAMSTTNDVRNPLLRQNKDKKPPVSIAEPELKVRRPPEAALENITSEKGLRDEVEKWRIFGKMMAESYEDLNKRYLDYMSEKDKDKKVISTLREQINTLKALVKAAKEDNLKLKEINLKSNDQANRTAEENKEIALLMKELESIKSENKETSKMIEFLRDENDALKTTMEEGQKHKDAAEHYQKLAEVRFKECSALAEEIICLRTDLDRSHSNYLRIQREQSSGKKFTGDPMNLVNGSKQNTSGQGSQLGSANSGPSKKKWADFKVTNWNEELDDHPPSPADFTTLPSKEESTTIKI